MECGFIDETEFNKVAAEATARMTRGNWSFKRPRCVYSTQYCSGCGECVSEDLDAEANSNYMKAVF